MWIVRRMTTVRTSAGGLAAASDVAVLLAEGLRANAASPAATRAVTAAAVRVCLLRIPDLQFVDRGLLSVSGLQSQANRR
jgi:hypothetical protein